MSLSKIALGIIAFVVVVISLIYFVPYFLKDTPDQDIPYTTEPIEVVEETKDPLVQLQQNNKPYAEAMRQIKAGDLDSALANLKKSKELVSTPRDNANIDFAIADVLLNLNRSEGIDAYSALALNTSYTERTRALAILRAYLMYKKFNQVSMLQQIAQNHSINWTIPEQVTYEIMKQANDLHSFPYAQVKMLDFELNTVTDTLVAQQLFRQQEPLILERLDQQKAYIGESTELTSGMLAYANLLSRLFLEFSAVAPEKAQTAYEDLIDYDNARNITVNKQYALLSYANFLAGDSQIEKATSVIKILLDETLTPALAESLPLTDAQVVYPYMFDVLSKETTDETVRAFIATIGSKII